MDSLRELERSTQAASLTTDTDVQPTQNKLSYEARKEQSKTIKKWRKPLPRRKIK